MSSTPSTRARAFLHALGVSTDDTTDGLFALGRPELLLAEVRAGLRARYAELMTQGPDLGP